MAHLFQPITFRSVTARNRIAVSPMCQYSSDDGFAGDWHLVHLGTRAVGGAGIVFTEAAAVSPEGRISYADLGIWKEEHVKGLARITAFIEAQGAVPGIQLAHAGRKAGTEKPWLGGQQLPTGDRGWTAIGPSALPFRPDDRPPKAATQVDIEKVIDDFREAAARSLRAGFQLVEIHAAHGYLLHSFHSPAVNHRTDAYGGAFDNRIRLTLEVVRAVREVWPEELPLFVRISADDWLPGRPSWTIDDSVRLAHKLKDLEVDLIDVSSGGVHPEQQIAVGAGYQTPFAARIRQEAGIATGAVGLITAPAQAETILRTGQADLILMARELLRNPYFPYQAAEELRARDFEWPKQYERGKK